MKLDGAEMNVLLRDVQTPSVPSNRLHVDFQRIDPNTKMHMKVPLHFINDDIAPGVKLAGGIVSHVMNEMNVSCLPKDLPEFIEVDLANLAAGHSLHVNDMPMPTGVEIVERAKIEDPAVATIMIPSAVAVEEEATADRRCRCTGYRQAAKDKVDDKAGAKARPRKKRRRNSRHQRFFAAVARSGSPGGQFFYGSAILRCAQNDR